jgi:hypothetical protein
MTVVQISDYLSPRKIPLRKRPCPRDRTSWGLLGAWLSTADCLRRDLSHGRCIYCRSRCCALCGVTASRCVTRRNFVMMLHPP